MPYAEFLAEVGGDVLVAGPPMRTTLGADHPRFIDLEFAKRFSDVAHAVADAVLRRGVKLALHTEAHSSLCTRRDVNLLMALTDPQYVHLCPDTAHITLMGGDPVEVVAPRSERVAIAHWKDASGPMPAGIPIDDSIHESNREYMVTLGTGAVDWYDWSSLYDSTPGADVRLLELDAVPEPIDEMKKALAFFRSENDIAESPPTGGAAGSAAVAPPTAGTPTVRCRPKGGSRSSELDDVAAAALLARSAYRHG